MAVGRAGSWRAESVCAPWGEAGVASGWMVRGLGVGPKHRRRDCERWGRLRVLPHVNSGMTIVQRGSWGSARSLHKRNKKNVRFRSHQRVCESTMLCVEEGQRDDKVASLPTWTLHADRPTVLLNDPLGNGE